eukprot:658139-Amorphochlora_amoeboformis.AAC.1
MSEMKQRKKIVENEDSKPTVMPSNTDKDSTGKDKDLFATYNSLMVSYPFTVNAVQVFLLLCLNIERKDNATVVQYTIPQAPSYTFASTSGRRYQHTRIADPRIRSLQ